MRINPENIRIEDYNYELADEKIAKYPLQERDKSQLLIYNKGELSKDSFFNIDKYIDSDTSLVFNNTKVIQARLEFFKETGAKIEIFCLEPIEPADYNLAFQETHKIKWKCIVGNSKKWKSGCLKKSVSVKGLDIEIKATRIVNDGNSNIIEFSWDNNTVSFSEILENSGLTPIPPYLNRDSEDIDKDRYQTVYSKQKGSVAAPTAGLHFTNNVLTRLQSKNISTQEVTLHVGAGTFKPVKSETIDEHEMHTEHFIINKQTVINLLNSKKIIAVGTTSVRTIESVYWLGVKLILNKQLDKHITQWEAYKLENGFTKQESLQAIIDYMEQNDIDQINASTQIMIFPGYNFKIIDALITNFHQPKSTLLLLIGAFIGDNWKEVYKYALDNSFRFLSYGDSSILIP
ncbi:MAG: S-adenosylmethionine:tRNA ribosyltransferase-isomerase [Bacteroidales bacterium]|nr:S-adenosylmethionine:tRNA ribosyltransferase-isomerase [Bacteroidales bacterium]